MAAKRISVGFVVRFKGEYCDDDWTCENINYSGDYCYLFRSELKYNKEAKSNERCASCIAHVKDDTREDTMGRGDLRLCESCKTVGRDIEYQPNPFANEIHGIDTPMNMCDSCAYESSMDI